MVELVQVVLSREDGPVGEHLSQDAAHRPDVDGLGVALGKSGKGVLSWPQQVLTWIQHKAECRVQKSGRTNVLLPFGAQGPKIRCPVSHRPTLMAETVSSLQWWQVLLP